MPPARPAAVAMDAMADAPAPSPRATHHRVRARGAGLQRAIAELLPETVWPRGAVHVLRTALDALPRNAGNLVCSRPCPDGGGGAA